MDYIKEEKEKILNELLENKIIKPGQVINHDFFQKIYIPYKEIFSEKEFAELLEISITYYRQLKNDINSKAIILKSLVTDISVQEKAKIIDELINNNKIIPSQLISNSYFQELYEPYKELLTEVKFAELLEISYDNFTSLKYHNSNAKVLKSKTDKLIQIKQKIINDLLSTQKINSKQWINYNYFLELYQPYHKTFTDKQFASILEIDPNNFKDLKSGKNKRVRILNKTLLSKEEQEQNKKIINTILSLEDIEPGILINYKFFQKLYIPFKNKYTEKEFANLLEISYSSFFNIKKYPNKKASVLKSYKKVLTEEEKENIVNQLLSSGTAQPAELISYKFFLELYEPYKKIIDESEFSKLLEITSSNFRSFKYQGTQARILKSFKKGLSEKEKCSIVDELFSTEKVYMEQPINYEYFLELYEPYKIKLTQIKFAELLGISYEAYQTIKRRENSRAKVYDYRIKEKIDKIEYILGQESRFYSKEEIYSLSKKYNLDINLIMKYIFCKGSEEHLNYFINRLNTKDKLYFGKDKCSKKFAEKYSKYMIDIASTSSLKICNRYNCKNKQEDFATDALIYILENGRDIEENCSDNTEVLRELIKAKIIISIRNSCFRTLNKPKVFQTSITYTNHKGNTSQFEADLEDKTHNVQDIVEEKEMIKFLTKKHKNKPEEICMAVLMQYVESGLSREEALAATAKSLKIDSKKMLNLLEKYLVDKKKVKKTSDGDYMLW